MPPDPLLQITPHFRLREFGLPADKATEYGFAEAPYPAEWVEPRLRPLCLALERLRDACGGRAVAVISGYRPREYDLRRIAAGHRGVSPNSQHHQGLAADVRVAGLAAPQVYQIALRLHSTSQVELGGLGFYASQDFVHVDLRQLLQPGRLRTWDGDAPR